MKRLIMAITLLCAPIPALAANLNVSGTDFGSAYSPDSVTQNVKIKATGGPGATINSITLGGANSGDFVINSDDCSGKSPPPPCSINITFAPTAFGDRTATLTINAKGADNTNPAGDGDLVVDLTGVGEGCGDGVVNGPESCDFRNTDDIDCCDDTCTPTNKGGDCTAAGGCLTGGTCDKNGTCAGATTSAGEGAACSNNNSCVTGETCDASDVCDNGTLVSCPTPATCFDAGSCNPADGTCDVFPSAAGTVCNSTGTCDGSGNCVGGINPSGGGCSLSQNGTSGVAMSAMMLLAAVGAMTFVAKRRRS